jgi:preprotein translocase subunit SecF
VRGLNLGIDFTGGVDVETNFPQAPNIDQLRSALDKAGVAGAQVTGLRQLARHLVRLPPDPNVKGEQIGARILEVFGAIDPGVKLQSTEVVGPQVGQELFVKGGEALFATLVLIAVYVLCASPRSSPTARSSRCCTTRSACWVSLRSVR